MFSRDEVLRMELSDDEDNEPPDLSEFSDDSETVNPVIAQSDFDEDDEDEVVNFENLNVTVEEESTTNENEGEMVDIEDQSFEPVDEREDKSFFRSEDEESESSDDDSDFEMTLRGGAEQRGNKSRRVSFRGATGSAARGTKGVSRRRGSSG